MSALSVVGRTCVVIVAAPEYDRDVSEDLAAGKRIQTDASVATQLPLTALAACADLAQLLAEALRQPRCGLVVEEGQVASFCKPYVSYTTLRATADRPGGQVAVASLQTAVAVSPSPDEGEGGKYQEYTFTFWTDFAQLHAAKTAHLDANPIEPASWSDAIPAEEPADEPVADADAGMDDS